MSRCWCFSTATGKTTPWLATGWGFSDDGKRLTFTLRDGVKWSDGQPFTARDVAFTLNLLKQNPGLSGSGGIRGVMDTMTGAAAADDRTCTVDFSRAFTRRSTPSASSRSCRSTPGRTWPTR